MSKSISVEKLFLRNEKSYLTCVKSLTTQLQVFMIIMYSYVLMPLLYFYNISYDIITVAIEVARLLYFIFCFRKNYYRDSTLSIYVPVIM